MSFRDTLALVLDKLVAVLQCIYMLCLLGAIVESIDMYNKGCVAFIYAAIASGDNFSHFHQEIRRHKNKIF